MTDNIEFQFSLKNLFTPAIKKAEVEGKKAFDTLDKEADEFNKKLKNTKTSAESVGSSLSGLKSLAGKLFAGFAIVETVKSMANLSIEAEQNRIAFTTFLGSVDKANDSLAQLKHFAAVTPFSSREVIDVSKALLGFGVRADELQPTLKALGDVSSGTGKNFKELAVIFGQIKSVGKLMGGDLMQLRQAGIPIVKELAKNFGTTEAAITEMVHKGQIGFKDVEKAFSTMTSKGGMFFNLMENQSKSLGGRLSTLVDYFEVLGTQFGDRFLAPIIGGFIDFSNSFLENIEPVKNAFNNLLNALSPIGDAINELGIAFGLWTKEGLNGASVAQGFANIINTYVVPAARVAASVIKTLADFIGENSALVKGLLAAAAGAYAFYKGFMIIQGVIKVIQGIRVAFLALNAVMAANPIGLIVVAIGALVGAFIYAWNEIDGFKESILGFWEAAKYAFTNLGTFIPKVLANIGKFFTDTFQPFFEAIDAFKRGDYATAAKQAGKGLFLTATIPQRLVMSTFNGDLFKGTGADEVFNKTKADLLRQKKLEEAKAAFNESTKTASGQTAQAISTDLSNDHVAANAGLKETSSRVGSGPTSVTVNLNFEKESFKYEVNSVAESRQMVEEEFAKILVNIGNLTTRAYK